MQRDILLSSTRAVSGRRLQRRAITAAVTYTVNRLAADTTYTFRIKAYAISGESEIYSDYVRIAGKTRIANVASFKGSAVSASAVKLDWSKNDKATGYVIEQYKGGKWTQLPPQRITPRLRLL